jgi:hypothetical protein
VIERHGIPRWLAVGALGLVLAAPVTADWLVTHDGARVETKGPWKVKGNQVVFTLPNGIFSALRKAEVNLDASASATAGAHAEEGKAAASASSAQEKTQPRKVVAVFNNSNIGRAVSEDLSAPEVQDKKQEPGEKPIQNAQVEIVSWSERDNAGADGLEIVGTVKNTGSRLAANISVKVTVVDEAGETRFETAAFMRSTGLVPGKSTTFRALLPGIFTLFTEPRFEVKTDGVEVTQATPQEIDEENQNP